MIISSTTQKNLIIRKKRRLAFASVLGPFRVHLLKFALPTPVHWCTICGYWNFWFEFVMPHTHHNTHENYLIYPMIAISSLLLCDFLLLLCSHIRLGNALLNIIKCMSSRGIIETSGYSLKCVVELVASTLHAKVSSSEAPHLTGFSQTFSKTWSDFLSHNH